MEIYLLDVELLGFFSHSNPKLLVAMFTQVQQGLEKKSPLKNVGPIALERSTPSLSPPHPQTQTQSVQSDFGVFPWQEGKQESLLLGESLY